MKADFDFTADDLVAFSTVHNKRSPTARRQRYGCLLVGLAMLLALPALILFTTDKPYVETAAAIWPLLLGPVLFVLSVTPYMKWKTKRIFEQMVAEGNNSGLFGECSLSIDPDGIREIKSSGETMRSWNGVEKLVVTDEHAFIYTSAIEAFVLPRRAFKNEERFQAFVDEIAKRANVASELE